MVTRNLIPLALIFLAIETAGGQVAIVSQDTTARKALTYSFLSEFGGGSRVGITVSSSASPRDTLGVLVSRVTAGSAAAQAGVVEGSRIAAINGVNLRVSAADVGESDMQGFMARRFQREISRIRAGDTLRLSVFAEGRFSDVTVVTEAPKPVNVLRGFASEDENRASIGAVLSTNASRRDTLGVLVIGVAEKGPLAMASLYEGTRIAAIGGVDLRAPAAAAGNATASAEQRDKLVAELKKLDAGATVELRVYDAGQYRNVSIATMRLGDIDFPNGEGALRLFNSGDFMIYPKSGLLHDRVIAMPRLDSIQHIIHENLRVIPGIQTEVIEGIRSDMERLQLRMPEFESLRLRERLEIPRLNLPRIVPRTGMRIIA